MRRMIRAAVRAMSSTCSSVKSLRRRMDPGRYNGASLLGLKGIVIKSHGSADAYAFRQALVLWYEELADIG